MSRDKTYVGIRDKKEREREDTNSRMLTYQNVIIFAMNLILNVNQSTFRKLRLLVISNLSAANRV